MIYERGRWSTQLVAAIIIIIMKKNMKKKIAIASSMGHSPLVEPFPTLPNLPNRLFLLPLYSLYHI